MRKKNGISKIIIALAFAAGIASNFAARFLLPKVLPEPWVPMTDLLSFLVQVVVSVLLIVGIVFVFKIGED